jgi:hypothetical protein
VDRGREERRHPRRAEGHGDRQGHLWVADITFVRKFERKTGKPLGSIEVKGATFLNDVAARADGSLVVTDTGLKPDFSESGTHALVTIGTDEKVTVEPTPGKQPNGIAVLPSGALCYVTWNTGELIIGKAVVGKMPKAQLDGIVALSEDHFLVSSWEAQSVYEVTRQKEQKNPAITVLIREAKAPADLGYDKKRKQLLLPMFQDDKVVLWPL